MHAVNPTTLTTLFSTFLAVATLTVAAPSAAATPLANAPIPSSSRSCPPSLHAITLSGQGSPDYDGYGSLKSLVDSVVEAIPDSTQVTLTFPKSSTDQVYKHNQGALNLVQYLKEYRAACPKTKLALLTYSSGSIIAMNTICGPTAPWSDPDPQLPSNWTSSIVAVVNYGDETYVTGQDYNAGTCANTDRSGEVPRRNPEGCAAWTNSIKSYCNARDPRCCGGDDQDAHFTYPEKFDGRATDFVVSRYEAAT